MNSIYIKYTSLLSYYRVKATALQSPNQYVNRYFDTLYSILIGVGIGGVEKFAEVWLRQALLKRSEEKTSQNQKVVKE